VNVPREQSRAGGLLLHARWQDDTGDREARFCAWRLSERRSPGRRDSPAPLLPALRRPVPARGTRRLNPYSEGLAKRGGDRLHAEDMAAHSESEVIAQQLSALSERVAAVEARLVGIDKVIARLEGAAITTARAMEEISRHWDAVYRAMGRDEEADVGERRSERDSSRARLHADG
jgi:hypothetical protein